MLKRLSLVPAADVVSGRNHFNRGQTEVESLTFFSYCEAFSLGVTVCMLKENSTVEPLSCNGS